MTIKDFIMDFDNENYSKSLDILGKENYRFYIFPFKGRKI